MRCASCRASRSRASAAPASRPRCSCAARNRTTCWCWWTACASIPARSAPPRSRTSRRSSSSASRSSRARARRCTARTRSAASSTSSRAAAPTTAAACRRASAASTRRARASPRASAASARSARSAASWLDSDGIPDPQRRRHRSRLREHVVHGVRTRRRRPGRPRRCAAWYASGTSEYSDFFVHARRPGLRELRARRSPRISRRPRPGRSRLMVAHAIDDLEQNQSADFLDTEAQHDRLAERLRAVRSATR